MIENKNLIEQIVANINRVIVGKKSVIELLAIALACDGHVLIEDVPGTGKTTLALALSKTINGSMQRVSCTPDVLPSDITGFTMYNSKNNEFEYRQGAIMANVFLADEINRTPPKTQSGLLEAMEEGKVTVDGVSYPLPKPFMVMATQNPIEYLGTYPLPEAQMDRFFMKISLGYPTEDEELEIMNRFSKSSPLESLNPIVTLEDIMNLQKDILDVRISVSVSRYIAEIAKESRNDKNVALGISPRGSLYLVKAAKAWAYYQGRDYVIPDDVKYMLLPVCAHRITPRAEAKYENLTSIDLLLDILKRAIVPKGEFDRDMAVI